MIRFDLDMEDLARTRFAISPMWETAAAIRALRNPSVVALHLPWVKRIRPAIRDMDLSLALALLPRKGYIADFLTPPPSTPLADFYDELELVRSTSTAQITNDVEIMIREGHPRADLRPYIDDPRAAVEELAEVLLEFWQRALEPDWPRVRSLLEGDLLYRSRRLTEGGAERLFEDLHSQIAFHGDTVQVDVDCGNYHAAISVAGRGLVLVPSAFSSQRTSAMTEEPWQPTLIYPARGVALLWEESAPAPEALAKVLGRSRAALLADLDAPRSTTDLAQRLEMTPGGVSQHLTALKDSGFVTARRNGRAVLYCRSELADQLVGAG